MNQQFNKTFSLFSRPYLDKYEQCYKNIVTINCVPKGPLGQFVKKIQFPPLSQFKVFSSPCENINNCGYAILSFNSLYCGKNGSNLMTTNEVPDLISYLISNGYNVDTSITKMFNSSDIRFEMDNANKLICFVTYNG